MFEGLCPDLLLFILSGRDFQKKQTHACNYRRRLKGYTLRLQGPEYLHNITFLNSEGKSVGCLAIFSKLNVMNCSVEHVKVVQYGMSQMRFPHVFLLAAVISPHAHSV